MTIEELVHEIVDGHADHCSWNDGDTDDPCDCGLEGAAQAILAEFRRLEDALLNVASSGVSRFDSQLDDDIHDLAAEIRARRETT